jgi:hypothetical protein
LMKLVIALAVSFLIQGTSASGPSSIEGIVVKQGTNEPLAGAELELSRVEGTSAMPLARGAAEMFSSMLSDNSATLPENALPQRGVDIAAALNAVLAPEVRYGKSGSDGRFVFSDLKEGKYRLAAVRGNGLYYPAEFGQRHPTQRGLHFPLAAGETLRDLKLEMTPTGAISGRVVDEDGQPLGHTVVYALADQFRAGQQRPYIETLAMTDERGNYRLFALAAGKYSVAVAYPNHQRRTVNLRIAPLGPVVLREHATSPVVTRQTLPDGSVIEEAYGIVYSGGVVDPAKATLIEVRPGTTFAGVDIPMGVGKRRTYHIRGVVLNNDTGQPVAGAQVLATPRQSSPLALVLSGTSDAEGVFDLAGAFPEGYAVSANGSGASIIVGARTVPGPLLIGFAPIEMSGSDVEVRMVLKPPLTLRGSVVIQGRPPGATDPALAKARIRLTREPDLIAMPDALFPPSPPNGQVTASGEFTLSMSPGDFRIDVDGVPDKTYVKSIRLGREDILLGGLHLTSTPDGPLEITLGIDGGTITGSVTDGMMRPFSNATIALVPDARGRWDLFRSTASDSTGAFRLGAIPPGNYKLFAWEWVPSGSWVNADFLRTYESQGTSVQVEAPGSSNKDEKIRLIAIASSKEAR